MSKAKWKFKLNNIGGLIDKYEFDIHSGLNIVEAPNATGKSSIANAIRLLCADGLSKSDRDSFLRIVLNENSSRGEVNLFSNGLKFQTVLTRTPSGSITLRSSELPWESNKAFEVAFCVPDSELLNIINSNGKGLKNWFTRISDVDYYSTLLDVLDSKQMEKQREKNKFQKQMTEDPDKIEEEITSLNSRMKKLDEDRKEIDKKLVDLGYKEEKMKQDRLRKKKNEISKELDDTESHIYKLRSNREIWSSQKENAEVDVEHLELEMNELSEKYAQIKTKKSILIERLEEIKEERTLHLEVKADLERKAKKLSSTLESESEECEFCGGKINSPSISTALENYAKSVIEENNLIDAFKAERESINKEFDEIRFVEKQIANVRGELDNQNSDLNGLEGKLRKSKPRFTELQTNRKELRKQLDAIDNEISQAIAPRTEEANTLNQRNQEISGQKNEIRRLIRGNVEKLETVKASNINFKEIEAYLEVLNPFIEHIKNRYDYLMNGVRIDLNRHISEAIELMEYTSFESIQILDDFSLRLVRKNGTTTELNRISTSEKLTITLLVMFITKMAYAPKFPLFIVDEVMGAYDRTRFKRILEFVRNEVEYLVVTSLIPLEEQQDIKIKHHID